MAADTDLEREVRTMIRAASTGITADQQYVHRTIDRATEASRRRRGQRKVVMTVAAVAVVVATGALPLSISQESDPTENVRDTAPPTEPAGEAERIDPFDWAQSLRRGADANAAYVSDGVLYAGEARLSLPGGTRQGTVLASVNDGWIVSISPGQGRSQTGLLSALGDFTPFTDVGAGQTMVFALSPDGTTAAVGDAVIEVASGERIGSVPQNAYIARGWTHYGFVYLDRNYDSWLWEPGLEPRRIGPQYTTFTPDGVGFMPKHGGCSTINRMRPDGDVEETMQYCDAQIAALSPSGNRAFTLAGTVISVPDGDVEATFPVPGGFERLMAVDDYTTVWENEGTVLIAITNDNGTGYVQVGPRRAVIVRCTVSTETCERASDDINEPRGTLQMVPPAA